MTTAIKRRRGTTAQHSTFTGIEGEITVDTTKDTLVVHDGAQAGGYPLLREDLSNNTAVSTASNTQILTNKTIAFGSNTVSGTIAQFNTALTDGDFATLAGTETLSNKTFSTNPTISSGTANGVAYLNGSKVLTTGSALTFNGTVFAVGGTPSSGYKLVCYTASGNNGISIENGSNTGSDYSVLDFRQASTQQAVFYTNSGNLTSNVLSGANIFQIGATEQMRLTSTGLGIGTSSPSYKLDVRANYANVQPSNGTDAVGWRTQNTGGQMYFGIDSSVGNNFDTGTAYAGVIWRQGAYPICFVNNSTEKMRLDSSGNLGLGVTPATATRTTFQIGAYGTIDNNGGTGIEINSNAVYNSGWKYIASAAATQYYQFGGTHVWQNAPSGTAGNAITFTQAMTLDASGNLGIGTSPLAANTRLSVYGGRTQLVANSDSYALGVGYASAGAYYLGANSTNDSLVFSNAAGSERMRIDSSGNVGIGTSSPGFPLDVVSRAADAFGVRVRGRSSDNISVLRFTSNDAATNYGQLDVRPNTFMVRAVANIPMEFWTNDTERMRIDSSGNVGIGTSSPADKLQVEGNIYLGTTNRTIYQGGSADLTLQVNTGATRFLRGNGASESMRIDSSGNLLVGTASATSNSGPGIKLLPAWNGANQPELAIVTSASANTSSSLSLYSTGAGAFRFYVADGGTIYATSTAISGISDQRFKENVRDLDDGLDTVLALKPRKFDWKQGKGKDIKNDRGFIAQEFEQVFPDLIDEWKDPAPEGEEPYKSVRQDLIPVLVKAIQEQQALIIDLQDRLTKAGL